MHDDFVSRGRTALLSGRASFDVAFAEGHPRWGASAVLRPAEPVLSRLASLSASLESAAGPGHWAHGPETLHFTLRSLEPYRSVIPLDDPLRLAYASAARKATAGLAPVQVELVGVSPHSGGVVALGRPVGDGLVTLAERFAEHLGEDGAFQSWVRDRWYVSLMHFAQPLADPKPIVTWCDEHAGVPIGVAQLDAVDIVQAVRQGAGVRLDTLERAVLEGSRGFT